ncbi:MAG: YraN family protein [Euzebyales bacterium]|jgi:putative endonuclease|nr:YraN family protein [Euzebyales bacterium]
MTTSPRAALGAAGEQLAARALERAGMVLLARNWRCATRDVRGELDIVARDGRTLVFCEVKARRGGGAGEPAEAVTYRKLAQLRALASAFLAETELRVREVRIDVVAVTWPAGGGTADVTHLRGVG